MDHLPVGHAGAVVVSASMAATTRGALRDGDPVIDVGSTAADAGPAGTRPGQLCAGPGGGRIQSSNPRSRCGNAVIKAYTVDAATRADTWAAVPFIDKMGFY